MKRKSPLTVTYADLILEQTRHLQWIERFYPGQVASGALSSWTANHRIACARQLLSMLKKAKKDPQGNLNDIFDKTYSTAGVGPAHNFKVKMTPIQDPVPAERIADYGDDPDFFTTGE